MQLLAVPLSCLKIEIHLGVVITTVIEHQLQIVEALLYRLVLLFEKLVVGCAQVHRVLDYVGIILYVEFFVVDGFNENFLLVRALQIIIECVEYDSFLWPQGCGAVKL